MSLTKDELEKAKRKVAERLTSLYTDDKPKQDSGIAKLKREYKHAFKKIEYIPKIGKPKVKPPDSSLGEVSIPLTSAQKRDSAEEIPSAVPPEDIHDSNSSNLSSRLDNAKDDVKIRESITPFCKTPLLLGESADNEQSIDETTQPNETNAISNDVLQGQQKQKLSLLSVIVPGILAFHRRRRRKQAQNLKKEPALSEEKSDQATIEALPKSNEQEIADKFPPDKPVENVPVQVQVPVSLMVESSSVLPTSGSVRRSSQPGGQSKSPSRKSFPAVNKGLVDLMLRRNTRNRRHTLPRPDPSTKRADLVRHDPSTIRAELSSEERHQEVLGHFRRCVRLFIHVRVLLNVSRIRIEEEEKSKEFKRFDGGLELSFDATMFKTAMSYSGLTVRARKALKKAPIDRTEEDARTLMEILLRLPMFNKYPKSVKQALVKMMWYDVFQNGRVILKQGDPGTRMYFVISGEVDLIRTVVTDEGEEMVYHIRTVREGNTFGELALIRNVNRDFTAVCRGTSEFLSLSKDEFNQALRYIWERDCNLRFDFLRSCEHFSKWTDRQLQICADSSQLKEYTNNSVILGNIARETENVYFISKGRCEIVRRILVTRRQSPYLRPLIMLANKTKRRGNFLNKSYCRDRRIERDEVKFMTVTTLQQGNYFGVGENLRDTFIIAKGKTELLIVNSAQFSILGKSEQLRRLKRERENSLPSDQEVFEKFEENRKWFEYRNQLFQDIIKHKPPRIYGNTKDIPKTILSAPTIPKDLIFYHNKF